MRKGVWNFVFFLIVASLYITAIFKIADAMEQYSLKQATFAFRGE